MDWARYKELERQEEALKQAATVTVAFTYDEFLGMKYGVMLLRRMAGDNGDLGDVDKNITPVSSKIYNAFEATPGVRDLEREREQMLAEANKERSGHGLP